MEYRLFGQTGMRLSAVGLGGLLAHYEGVCGHPPPEEKRRIYLRADELGVNLFDTGYGDEIHIPDELKGPDNNRYFALKKGAPKPDDLEDIIDKHLRDLRREAIDILRVHHHVYMADTRLAEVIATLKQAGKIRTLCLIRHYREEQEMYAERGPEPNADADLVIYNYVCRWQEPGIALSAQAGKGVLIMKALGGQWISWRDKTQTDWMQADEGKVLELAPNKHEMEKHAAFAYPINAGPWYELAAPGETIPRTSRAVQWVLKHPGVGSVLVAVASVEELEEALGTED